ncbi:hypothetical protein KKE13_01225 [Patescibacteria group bacterium]|nr:hypothetical protein [Patescibacteria group bacterium]
MLLDKQDKKQEKKIENCPYCQGKDIVKKGRRKKKMEEIRYIFANIARRNLFLKLAKTKPIP